MLIAGKSAGAPTDAMTRCSWPRRQAATAPWPGYAPECAVPAGSRPGGRGPFLCLPKEMDPKEKAAGFVGPLRGHTALLGLAGVWLNSLRSDNASPDPSSPALLVSS